MPPKRNVAFLKPEEPAFLKRMKAEIGYKEPDTIDAKNGPIRDDYSDEDDEDNERDDERPQVVQLKDGDLTAEEAAKLEKEESEKPADLTQRVIFKSIKKSTKHDEDKKDNKSTSKGDDDDGGSSKKKSKKSKPEKSTKNLLSFQDEDDEFDDE